MKALLVAFVLAAAPVAFAQTTYIDIPVDEAAMAQAPADVLKGMDDNDASIILEKADTKVVGKPKGLSKGCTNIVDRAASYDKSSEYRFGTFDEAGTSVYRITTGLPLIETAIKLNYKLQFKRSKCGNDERFQAEVRKRRAIAALRDPLEATSTAIFGNSSRSSNEGIRPSKSESTRSATVSSNRHDGSN